MIKNKILYIVIIVLIIGGGLFFFFNNKGIPKKNGVGQPTSVADKKIVDWATKIPHFAVLKTKEPKPDYQLSVTRTISAVQGGEIGLTDSKGVSVKLLIPAGGLSQDTDITLSPLEEVPIENYTSKLGNGVLVEPEGLKFSKNATLIFDFKPNENGNLAAGQPLNIPDTLPKEAGVVHVDSLQNRVNNTNAVRSIYGSKLLASISSLSSFVPDDLSGSNGEAVAESELPTEAADLGVCSQQLINTALKLGSYAEFFGDEKTASGILDVLMDCSKRAVDNLETKCQENPMQVRRQDIMNVMDMTQRIGPVEEASRAEQLMNDCKREYTMSGSKTVDVDQGTSTYSIKAKLCGFLDEKWEGTETADYTLIGAHDHYVGAVTFTLPQGGNGGDFYMTTDGQGVASSPFTGDIAVPFSGQGNLAFYDGQKSIIVNYQGFGNFNVDAPIVMGDNKCDTTDKKLNQFTGW